MPNHTTNKLTIEGASVDQFIEDAKGTPTKDEPFAPLSFKSLLPTPAELLESNEISESKMPDWHTWRMANWGTKWDAYDFHGEWQPNSPTNYSIGFYTAWDAPSNFFEKVSVDYPDITFVLDFADEGGAFLGRETIRNGNVEQTLYDWCSKDGKKHRKEMGIYFEEDEECEQS